MAACELPSKFQFLYPLDWSIKRKIETICKEIYRADGVDYSPEAERRSTSTPAFGFDNLPLCMAKTHLSLSHDPNLKDVPRGLPTFPSAIFRASVGAGFLYPLLGTMRTMPGLPTRPVFYDVDIDRKPRRSSGSSRSCTLPRRGHAEACPRFDFLPNAVVLLRRRISPRRPAWARSSGMRSAAGKPPRLPERQARSPKPRAPSARAAPGAQIKVGTGCHEWLRSWEGVG